jgi:hypothetical protein
VEVETIKKILPNLEKECLQVRYFINLDFELAVIRIPLRVRTYGIYLKM